MRNIRVAMIVAAFFTTLLCSMPAYAQFQGKINYSIKTDSSRIDMAYSAKGDNMRFDISKGIGPIPSGMSAIINKEDGQAMLLMSKQKMAIIMPMDSFEEMAIGAANSEKKSTRQKGDKDINIERTGRIQTIAGHSCEQWLVSGGKSDGKVVEIWIAKGLGTFGIFNDLLKSLPDWGKKLQPVFGQEGGIPLLITLKDKKGRENIHIEATSIIKIVDDAAFQVPAGYQIIDQSRIESEINEE
ncbi:MAG TPA: DUF4412 domain-containing protein [Patescibacteria group bacterium]|nr:DUF4412 domain-containing protein [Patescibacteria group bacterium]